MNKWSSSSIECHLGQGNDHSLQLSCQCLGMLFQQFMFLFGIIKTSALCLFSNFSVDNSEVLMILAKSCISRLVRWEGRWVCIVEQMYDVWSIWCAIFKHLGCGQEVGVVANAFFYTTCSWMRRLSACIWCHFPCECQKSHVVPYQIHKHSAVLYRCTYYV